MNYARPSTTLEGLGTRLLPIPTHCHLEPIKCEIFMNTQMSDHPLLGESDEVILNKSCYSQIHLIGIQDKIVNIYMTLGQGLSELLNVKAGYKRGVAWAQTLCWFEQTWWYVIPISSQKSTGMASAKATPKFIARVSPPDK